MENSKIEWTDHTANLWWGCEKVHAGCKNCYAETLDGRYHPEAAHWGVGSSRKIVISFYKSLNKLQEKAANKGVIERVFVGSMMDIFEDSRPVVDHKGEEINLPGNPVSTGELRKIFFKMVRKGLYPNLMFLLLTKRPENINRYIPESWKNNPPENVAFGCSVVNQETAEKMIPELLQVNGIRFLSCEPLLGHINLESIAMNAIQTPLNVLSGKWGSPYTDTWCPNRINWVIVGGESGHNARPMNPGWARSIRDQCKRAGVPFFFKQWGEWVSEMDCSMDISEVKREKISDQFIKITDCDYEGVYMVKVGKSKAGALLDGKEHKAHPFNLKP